MDPTQGRPKLSYTLTPITIPSPSGSKEEETRLYLRGTLSHAGPDSVENVSRSALRWLADWAGTEYTPSRRLSKGRPLKGSLERHTGSDGSSSWYIRRAGKTLYGASFDTAVRARFASDLLESCPELAAVEFVDSSVFARHQAGLARRGIPIMTVWHLPTEADGGRAAIIDDDQDRDDAADAEGTDGMVSTPITSTKRPPARVWVGISSIGERKAPIQNRSLHVMTNLDTDDDLASLYNATERYLQESRLHTDDHKYKTSDRLLQDAAKIASILRHSLPEELQGRTDVKAMPFYKLRAKLRRLHTRSDANRLMLLGRTNEEAALLMSGNSSSSAVKGAIFDGLGFEPAGQMGSKGGVKMAVAHGKQLWPSVAEWRDSVVDTS